MNDLVRPSSYFTRGIAASAPSGVLATIPNPPPDVARLPAGTTLRGEVLSNDGKGHVLVQTDQGVLSVATKLPLAKGNEVVLQIRSSGAQLHVMVMQARGQAAAPPAPSPLLTAPPAAALQGQGQPPALGPSPGGVAAPGPASSPGSPANPQQGPSGLPAAPGDRLNLGQIVRAVVQGPANPTQAPGALPGGQPYAASPLGGPLAGALPGAPTALAPGTVLALRIHAVTPPGTLPGNAARPLAGLAIPAGPPGAGPASAATGPPGVLSKAAATPLNPAAGPASAPPGAPQSGAQAAALGTPTPAGQAGPSGQPGAPQALQPPALAAPQAHPPGIGAGASGTPGAALNFSGQVTSVTHAGHPVLNTPLGTLTLEVEAHLPTGSRLALELAPAGLAKGAEAEAMARLSTAGSLGHAWPALEEALVVLSEAGAGSAGVPPGVPQPGPRLASGLLFFLAALSGGNLGRWLGAEALQTLRGNGRDSLIGRLSRDLGQMGRMAEGSAGSASGTGGDWRLLPIPLWDGDHVRQLRLFLRQHEKRQENDRRRRSKDPTRFVLELEMSRMGEMQLDGLVRDRRFDLVMRTRAALPEPMRRDIRQIFEDASQAAGYSGHLGFQASSDWHFLPLAQGTHSGEPPGLIV